MAMTGFSIHTNASALAALTNLRSVSTSLAKTTREISTGLKVGGATDNASVFAVAQGVRSTLAGNDAAITALENGSSAVSVAISGLTSVSNLLTSITSTLTSLADGSISTAARTTYSQNLNQEISGITGILQGSTFDGVNLINATLTKGTYTESQTVGFGTVISYITVTASQAVLAAPQNLILPNGAPGGSLTISAQDVYGGTDGTNGFTGLARLIYYVETAANGNVGSNYTSFDTYSSAFIGSGTNLISRSLIGSNEAIAALTPQSSPAIVTFGTAGATTSVFNGALANFRTQVDSALSVFGASSANIQSQITFVQSLNDTTNIGLGNLVDANLAVDSARLTAQKTQEALAIQSLSIANAQTSSVLELFH